MKETKEQKLETLDPEFVEKLRNQRPKTTASKERKMIAAKRWMEKLASGDYSGPTLDSSRYLQMRNKEVVGNPRQTDEYREKCKEAVGIGEKPDQSRYPHLREVDFPVIRWVVESFRMHVAA